VQTQDKDGQRCNEKEPMWWSADETKWSTDGMKRSLDETKPPDEMKCSTDGPEDGTISEYTHADTGCQGFLANKVLDAFPGNDSAVKKSSDFA